MLHSVHIQATICCGLLFLGLPGPRARADHSKFLAELNLPATTQQLLLVTAADWSASKGALQQYSRSVRAWSLVGVSFPVTLGRNGMGWGRGRFILAVQAGP